MMKLLSTVKILLILTILSSCQKEIVKPNIVWINLDDLGVELACYGNTDVKTPNIDNLASEGVRYTSAYATAPICSPSRSSMITGMYPTAINCIEHRALKKKKLPEGVVPVTKYFRDAGYFCTNGSGKNLKKGGKTDFNFKPDEKIFDGTDWSQRQPGQPFFAQVQIFEPHRPFVEDKESPVSPDQITLPASYPDHPLLRVDWAQYLESIQVGDKIVGKVLKRLEEEGLAENTVVFLFGDNGRPHLRDKQFLYEGGLHVPLVVRWPEKLKPSQVDNQLVSLIDVTATSMEIAGIPVPEHLHGNVFLGENAKEREYVFGFRQRSGDAVDNIRSISNGKFKLIWNRMPDIPYMQMSGYKKSEYPAYALFYYLNSSGKLEKPASNFMAEEKPEIELYDLESDPMEFNNLAGQEKFASVQDELFTVLTKNLAEFEKNWIMEDSVTMAKAIKNSRSYFDKNAKKMGLARESTDEEFVQFWENELLED